MIDENQIFLQALGKLIKKNRVKHTKTQAFLADLLGKDVDFIETIEKGEKEISPLDLSRLGRFYDLDLMAEVSNVIEKEQIKKSISFSSVLGSLISIKRKERGLSQSQLAEKIQLTRLTLSKIENGDANISAQKLAYLDTLFESDLMQEVKDKIQKLDDQQNVETLFDEEEKDNTGKIIAGASAIALLIALLR